MPTVSRRQLFRLASLFGAGALGSQTRTSAASSLASGPSLPAAAAGDPDVYKAIGVRPMINGRGRPAAQ